MLLGLLLFGLAGLSGGVQTAAELKEVARWRKGMCKNEIVTLQPDFHPEKFFTGTWYVSQTIGTLFESFLRKCGKAKGSISGGNIQVTISEYVPLIFSTLSHTFTVQYEDPKKPNYNISWLGIDTPFSVLSTDYDNYALVYSCKPEPLGLDGYISELVVVLRRTRGDTSKMEEIRDAAWNNGIVFEEFASHDTNECE